jgi:hypothetical protein
MTTIGTDLAHDSLAHEVWLLDLFHYPNELVAQHASKARVAPDDLEIGVADASQRDPDARLAWRR